MKHGGSRKLIWTIVLTYYKAPAKSPAETVVCAAQLSNHTMAILVDGGAEGVNTFETLWLMKPRIFL